MTLIKPTNKWDKLAFNFWTFYRDKNMFFIYENGNLLDCSLVTSATFKNNKNSDYS